MPKKKNADQDAAADAKATTAKTPDATAEKAAPAAAPPAPRAPAKIKIPKLAKKNKSRLPRREKKAQQKAADRK